MESHITHLQDEATSLRVQVSTLREVLETELERMHEAVQRQLADATSAFSAREAASTSRLDRLEEEIRRLTRACEQAIRAEELLDAADEGARGASTEAARALSMRLARPGTRVLPIQNSHATERAVSSGFSDSVDMSRLLPRIERVFDFYTLAHVTDAELLQPEMRLHQFTAMVRDSGLGRCGRTLPPELLWMAVLRDLPSSNTGTSSRNRNGERRLGSTLLLPRVFDGDGGATTSCGGDETKRGGPFSRERQRSITKTQFLRALYVVFRATTTGAREAAVATDAFCVFLSHDFLPSVEHRIQRRQASQLSLLNSSGAHRDAHSPALLSAPPEDTSAMTGLSRAASDSPAAPPLASVVAEYKADAAAQAVLQQFAVQLRRCFRDATRCPLTRRTEDARMGVDAFVDVARRHQLLPLVSRVQLRDIFTFCLTVADAPVMRAGGAAAKPAALEALPTARVGISFAVFASAAVFCLADVIYGASPPLRAQFPSPSARLTKLLVKMLVLV